MNNGYIQDGTGKGYLAQVFSNNSLSVKGVYETTYDDASLNGNSFNVNTEFVSVTVGTETPFFYFKNNESEDAIIVAWFVGLGISGGSPTENALLRVYPNPTGVSGGVDVNVANRRVGSGRSFLFDCKKQNSGTPLLATAPATPLIFVTQTASTRTFNEVYLTVPRSQSLLVTIQANGAQTLNAYTGFTGYVRG